MPPNSTDLAPSATIVGSAGWKLFVHEEVSSTNDLARKMPPWTAVRASTQTAARGRFGRSFVSDAGGLWLSATLPAGNASQWSGFSLMIGHHLLVALRKLGVPGARLRWPNDLMSGSRKVAGLLIESGTRQVLTVGVGMNVRNTPWRYDSALANTSARLADLLPSLPSLEMLTIVVLDAMADAHRAMLDEGLATVIRELNAHWNASPVEVTLLGGETINGSFLGLDLNANLRVLTPASQERLVPHHHVARLKELDKAV
jgi:BirA family transcriptional regulator, biotin operon repressor / biotin---[acetyl-CoA-carboxylase] ligase